MQLYLVMANIRILGWERIFRIVAQSVLNRCFLRALQHADYDEKLELAVLRLSLRMTTNGTQ